MLQLKIFCDGEEVNSTSTSERKLLLDLLYRLTYKAGQNKFTKIIENGSEFYIYTHTFYFTPAEGTAKKYEYIYKIPVEEMEG